MWMEMHSVVMEVTRRERDAKREEEDECHFFFDHGEKSKHGTETKASTTNDTPFPL
jgi:hypothetical protein